MGHMRDGASAPRRSGSLRILADAMAASPQPFVIADLSGRPLEANQAYCSVLGYSRDELLSGTADLLAAEYAPVQAEALSHLRDTGSPVAYEVEYRHRDGSLVPVRLLAHLAGCEHGEAPCCYAFATDLSELRRLEAECSALRRDGPHSDLKHLFDALLEERERLAVTLRSIGDGVIVCDAKGRVVLMNGVAEMLTGWSEDEAIGCQLETVFVILNEKTGLRAADPVRRVLETGQVQGLANHTILVSRDGTRYSLADSGAPVRDQERRIVGVVLVFQDVTRRQRLEEELAKASKLESLGVLAGGMAHDFNNLLTAIMGNTILARMEAQDEPYLVELLLEAEKAAGKAKEVTQQLLTFAKGGVLVRRTVCIGDDVVEAARFVLRGSACRPEYDVATGLWPVDADLGQIRQAVHNLVMNAEEAMPMGGRVSVRVANVEVGEEHELPLAPGRYVCLTVTDEGIGISAEILPRIFDPYFTTKQKGSGLGLAVAYSIVTKHDGHIAVHSEPGQGSTFSIYLPAVAPPPARTQERTEPGTYSGRVLVMDDEEAVRRVAERFLKKLGFEAEVVADGAAAVESYARAMSERRPFTAVVLDLVVPGGMGGRETFVKLQEMDPGVRAIVSSGYANDPAMRSFDEIGFRAAIAKPFSLLEFETGLLSAVCPQRDC